MRKDVADKPKETTIAPKNTGTYSKEYDEILRNISQLEGKLRSDKSGGMIAFLSMVAFPALLMLLFFFRLFPMPVPLLIAVFVLFGIGVILLIGISDGISKKEEKLKYYEQLKENYLTANQQAPATPFDSLLQMNINNLDKQYQQTRNLANRGLWFCMLLGLFGFIGIGTGIGLSFMPTVLAPIPYVTMGVAALFIIASIICFFYYNKSLRQLKHYHDGLVNLQNMLVALKLTESMSEDKAKVVMEERVMDYLMDKINWF